MYYHNTDYIKSLYPTIKTFLDIGANKGFYSLELQSISEKIYAFEPLPENFNFLDIEIKNKKIQNIELYDYAVSDKNEKVWFSKNFSNTTNHIIYDNADESNTVSVDCITIDSMDITNIDVIKIDTEGIDYKVLLGAEKTIDKYRPTVCIEILEKNLKKFNTTPGDIYNFFKTHNYECICQIERPQNNLYRGKRLGNSHLKISKLGDRFFLPKENL
jgi:FkbM family methyltransferase